MEEWVLKIIIYVVFMKAILDLFGEFTLGNGRKKYPSLFGEDDDEFFGTCGGCIVDDRQKVDD